MKKFPINKAARTVGIAFILSVILVTIVDDFLLANFAVPGDKEQLSHDIITYPSLFYSAVVGYILVLILDAIISLALYIVLKPTNEKLARLTSVLRLTYVIALLVGVVALALKIIDVYDYSTIKLIGYVFFGLHILFLGYTVYKSDYLPKLIGVLLMVASLCYVVFFVDFNLSEPLLLSIMLLMAIAELSLSIWLIIKRNRISSLIKSKI